MASRRMALAARAFSIPSRRAEHWREADLPRSGCGPQSVPGGVWRQGYEPNQKDLTYIATPDLGRGIIRADFELCSEGVRPREGQFWVSVKDTVDNPFFGALRRHPIGSRRQAVISGKYGGGVFCTLSDETVCLCHYSTLHSDLDFHVGDTVILAIKQFDYERSLIYGRILSKW
ncbi:MAG: hypothetical protein ACLRJV_22640 [Eubacteriales bacterium]